MSAGAENTVVSRPPVWLRPGRLRIKEGAVDAEEGVGTGRTCARQPPLQGESCLAVQS